MRKFLENYNLYYSFSHDPHVNLALEFDLLNTIKPGEVSLFLYRNEPTIIFGRFQNPWREVKFTKLPSDITLVRRHSGGGTVYHDLGNWNFCFIRHGKDIEEKKNLSLICNILKKFKIEAHINERSDLIVKAEGTDKKVSGSAFRRIKDATLHHGTLLVDANLSSLRGVLGKEENFNIEGKGVASTPSSVINLSQINDKITWDTFLFEIEKDLSQNFVCLDEEFMNEDSLDYLAKLRSWEWKWGQGPGFGLVINNPCGFHGQISLSWSKGVIEKCQSQIVSDDPAFNVNVVSFLQSMKVHKESYSEIPDPVNLLFKYLYKIFLSQYN
mgnify:CR=1 FL=1